MPRLNKDKKELLLKEYAEAGSACRANEALVRTGLTIFVSVQAAIIGFIQVTSGSLITREVLLLEWLGFVASVATWISLLRLRLLYSAYIERAKCIERRLGLALYTAAWPFLEEARAPGQKIGNKKLLATLPATTFAIYLLLLVSDAPKYFTFECVTASYLRGIELFVFSLMQVGLVVFLLGWHAWLQQVWKRATMAITRRPGTTSALTRRRG